MFRPYQKTLHIELRSHYCSRKTYQKGVFVKIDSNTVMSFNILARDERTKLFTHPFFRPPCAFLPVRILLSVKNKEETRWRWHAYVPYHSASNYIIHGRHINTCDTYYKRGRELHKRCGMRSGGWVWGGGRNILAVVGAAKGASGKRQAKKNKKKVSGSVLTAGAAVSLLLPLLFASSLATAAGADLELLLLLLGRTPEDEMRSAGCQASVDRCAGTGA